MQSRINSTEEAVHGLEKGQNEKMPTDGSAIMAFHDSDVAVEFEKVLETLPQLIVANRSMARIYSYILVGIKIGEFETIDEIKAHCERNLAVFGRRVEHYFNQLPVTKM